jgi:hypothetical protein
MTSKYKQYSFQGQASFNDPVITATTSSTSTTTSIGGKPDEPQSEMALFVVENVEDDDYYHVPMIASDRSKTSLDMNFPSTDEKFYQDEDLEAHDSIATIAAKYFSVPSVKSTTNSSLVEQQGGFSWYLNQYEDEEL